MTKAPSNERALRDLVRACEQVTVTRVVVREGRGVAPDPAREVTYWYDADGWLIARRDGWEEAQSRALDAAPTREEMFTDG